MRVLEVADRPGWAIDRISKPVAQRWPEIDQCYGASGARFIGTGYTSKKAAITFPDVPLGGYDWIHFYRHKGAMSKIKSYRLARRFRLALTVCSERDVNKDFSAFDAVICPTRYVLRKVNHGNKFYIPFGIDVTRFKPGHSTSGAIGYVGRIAKHKQLVIVASVARKLDVTLIGCGYVDHRPSWKAMGKLLGDNLKFQVKLSEAEVPALYRKMGVYVCMSKPHIETAPLPVMEAMASGVPVISTRVGWPLDHCTDGENILFVDDESSLLQAIKSLDAPLRDRLIQGGLELISEFDLDYYAGRVREVYG